MTLFPDRELGGRVGGAFAVMNDIEDDIRIRDALKSQEAQMRLFADNIPGPDRVPRREPQVHVRQPGVRQLGVQAAGRDLRQDAVRGDGLGRRVVPAADPQARAGAASTSNTSASARRRRARGAGCTAASRPTSTRRAPCAASTAPNTTSTTSSSPSRRSPRARSSCACSTTTFRSRSSTSSADRRYAVRQRSVPAPRRARRASRSIGKTIGRSRRPASSPA